MPRKLLVLGVNDHIVPASRDWVTLDDFGNLVREPAVEARANALSLRPEAWLEMFDANRLQAPSDVAL
jgi:type I restriction enzyme R subunit